MVIPKCTIIILVKMISLVNTDPTMTLFPKMVSYFFLGNRHHCKPLADYLGDIGNSSKSWGQKDFRMHLHRN